jgi:hypothetical protein
MKPLPAAVFAAQTAVGPSLLADRGATSPLGRYILASSRRFPSIPVAAAALPHLKGHLDELTLTLTDVGINVFTAGGPAPLAALAQALGPRNIPLGLYLDETPQGDLRLTGVAAHGAPVDQQDLADDDQGAGFSAPAVSRRGVQGRTDLIETYTRNLGHLIDPYLEQSIGFSSLAIPFPAIAAVVDEHPAFRLLRFRSAAGPSATISPDGQALHVEMPDGSSLATTDMVRLISHHLVRVRGSGGTIVGPWTHQAVGATYAPTIGVEGTALEMSYQAGFADLLLGWWEPGIVAHQGNGAFGDGLLTAVYLLEAWNTLGRLTTQPE